MLFFYKYELLRFKALSIAEGKEPRIVTECLCKYLRDLRTIDVSRFLNSYISNTLNFEEKYYDPYGLRAAPVVSLLDRIRIRRRAAPTSTPWSMWSLPPEDVALLNSDSSGLKELILENIRREHRESLLSPGRIGDTAARAIQHHIRSFIERRTDFRFREEIDSVGRASTFASGQCFVVYRGVSSHGFLGRIDDITESHYFLTIWELGSGKETDLSKNTELYTSRKVELIEDRSRIMAKITDHRSTDLFKIQEVKIKLTKEYFEEKYISYWKENSFLTFLDPSIQIDSGVVREVATNFARTSYSITGHNCNHFVYEVLKRTEELKSFSVSRKTYFLDSRALRANLINVTEDYVAVINNLFQKIPRYFAEQKTLCGTECQHAKCVLSCLKSIKTIHIAGFIRKYLDCTLSENPTLLITEENVAILNYDSDITYLPKRRNLRMQIREFIDNSRQRYLLRDHITVTRD